MLAAALVRLAELVLPSGVLLEEPSARAEAPKLIAFLEFVGSSGARVRSEIMRLAAANFRVASTAKLDGKSVRDFALDHGLDVVVQGTVRKCKRGYQIRIRFLRGTTGQLIGGVTASVGEPALDDETKCRVQHELVRTLFAILPSSEDDETPTAVTCTRALP